MEYIKKQSQCSPGSTEKKPRKRVRYKDEIQNRDLPCMVQGANYSLTMFSLSVLKFITKAMNVTDEI